MRILHRNEVVLICYQGKQSCQLIFGSSLNGVQDLKVVYIEDLNFFEANTKYILSKVLKVSVTARVRSTSEIADIFNT